MVGTVAAGTAGVVALTGCSTSSGASAFEPSGSGTISVVATTNAWGSIAAQLGGAHVAATSIITNPDTDPHDYEPTPADARTVAGARVVVKNGVGYDAWADKLLAANPVSGRVVLDVGELVHVPDGGNPHLWYSPAAVRTVVEAITADYKAVDSAATAYFDARKQQFLTQGLARYTQLIAGIKATYGGTPVGASESIFTPLAAALGLNLITPPSFLKAISEGVDPSPADKATIDRQIATGAVKVYVFNSQNSTPDVAAQVGEARRRGIPVSAVTETLTPATASFQDWQSAQLVALQTALRQATGR